MPKTSHFFLLGSVLAVPFLGSSSAHAFSIVNQFGQCVTDRFGNIEDRNPIESQPCLGLFSQQWKWDSGQITGVGTGTFVPNPTSASTKCLSAFGNGDGIPVTLIECHAVLRGIQKWVRGFPGFIVNVGSGKCLTVENPAPGTQLTVRTCNPDNGNQHFSLRS